MNRNIPLELQDVTFAWPGAARTAVEGISCRFKEAEFVGIIGPNGAGKSTLLRLSAGLVKPGSGRISVFGEDPARIPRRRAARLAAFLPASLHAGFPLSVDELVSLGRTCHIRGVFGSESDRRAVVEAMRFTGILQFADRQYMELSAGEQRRVLLARAIAQESRLLLLDEPAANLDAAQSVRIAAGLAARAAQTGACIVAAIHDLNLALLVCDRVLLVSAGRAEAFGTPEEVMQYGTLKKVFGCDFYVGRNEINGKLFVAPMNSVK